MAEFPDFVVDTPRSGTGLPFAGNTTLLFIVVVLGRQRVRVAFHHLFEEGQVAHRLDIHLAEHGQFLGHGYFSSGLGVRAIHQIGFAGDGEHRVRHDLAGFHDLEAMAFVEAPCTVVFRVVDQAQALQAEVLGALLGVAKELHAQALAAPGLIQGQAGDVQGVGYFHVGVRREYRICLDLPVRGRMQCIAVHHADDATFAGGHQAVLV